MRITIEPTEHVDDFITVAVSSKGDDEDVYSIAELFRAALLAWGFNETSVDAAIPRQPEH